MAKKSTAKISNPPSLRVLVVEDSEDDTVVIIRALKKGGYDPQYERVETAADMRQALKDKTWDIILCDYQMPKFSGPQAIAVLKETNIDIPLIIVSGAIGEETAADCMRYGAHDYIMKGNLPRLVPAIERELLEAESRRKRKLAEESFKESEEKYRNLFENANEAIFVVQDVKLVFVNPMTTMMIGYSTEELMTRPFIEFIHPDDRDMVIDRHIRRMKGEEIPHLYSFRIVHRDGNIKWAEANAIVINWQGKAATLSFMSDITESKRAEERLRLSEKKFRTLYDSTCDAVMLLDEKGFFDCNKATLTMFGCATLEEFCSKHPADLSPPQQPCGTDSMVLANQLIATAMEKGSNHFEWVHKRNDTGETFPADVLLSTMELDDKLVIQAVVRDMTERKKAEEKLRTSEELLRNYLEYAPDGVYTNELNGTFLYGNRKCEEIIGYKREELIGKNFLELNILPEKSLNKALELLQANMEGKSTGPDEIELNSKEGRLIPVEISTSVVQCNGEGLVLAFVRDITERKKAEEKLLESEERYRALFDHSLNLVYLVDFEANFIDANDAALNRLGYTKEEMSSLNFASLLDEDQLSIAFKNTLDIIETGQQKNVLELRLRHKDGTDVYVETQGSVVMSNGKPSAIQAIALDITERKQAEDALRSSEERYRTIIETIPDAYFEADLAGNNTFCNNQYLVLTGYTKEELQGLNFRKLFDSQNAALTYKILNEVYRTGQPTMHAQFELINKAGERKYLESSISLIRDSQGKPVGFRGISRDITEKLQQAVLAFHSQKLESVGQLAAGIAHEINTPIQFIGDNIHFMKGAFQDILSLSAILNAVKKDDLLSPAVARDLLSRIQEKKKEIDLDFLEEEMPKAIEQSLDGLQRVSRIVQAMREFSHPGGEDMSDMNINKAIESTITLTKNEWKYSAELTTKLAPDLPIVQGYPADLNQVILNLIVNAAQALQEKVGKEGSEKERIEISTRQDGNEVEICIRDTGPGIPPEIQSRIFDPFFTTKALGKGTGQGLAIAQNIIVRKHGGKIFFETKPGEGTAFYIRLPLNKESTGQML